MKIRGFFARDTSSSNAARLRLVSDSSMYGSMFSESDSSGDGARLFKLGAELGVIAFCLFLMLCKLRSFESSRMPNGCRAGVETVAIFPNGVQALSMDKPVRFVEGS